MSCPNVPGAQVVSTRFYAFKDLAMQPSCLVHLLWVPLKNLPQQMAVPSWSWLIPEAKQDWPWLVMRWEAT